MLSPSSSGPEPGSFLALQARDFARVQNPARFSECLFSGRGPITQIPEVRWDPKQIESWCCSPMVSLFLVPPEASSISQEYCVLLGYF